MFESFINYFRGEKTEEKPSEPIQTMTQEEKKEGKYV